MSATTKRVYLTRHGEAEHNVKQEYEKYPDAILTALGRKQSQELDELTKDNIQQKAQLVVSSIMRRPMETMLLAYPTLIERLEGQGKKPNILDILQEVGPITCDVPTFPLEELKQSQNGIFANFDYSLVSPDTYASKEGIFHPENAQERAKQVRHWLRNREEDHIVVVAHGDILRTMVDGPSRAQMTEIERFETFRYWNNCAVKVFTFSSEDDDEALLIDVVGEDGKGFEPRDATAAPTSGEMA